MIITQGWRLISEMLRADCRGQGKISAYQIMSLLAIGGAVALGYFAPVSAPLVPISPLASSAYGIPRLSFPANALGHRFHDVREKHGDRGGDIVSSPSRSDLAIFYPGRPPALDPQ